ncbi:15-hydroxyprostaglandin dehydrogenase [NAD(+)]-like [Babylonia areolata]|uniref:15-hydroxyprostaglandin dehydrogenase [NAD(+)]-like n=1 Tax=Babylonia areolata TaxID=304850 RepID=UPI003FD19DBC
MHLEGKTALVTGGAMGLGLGVVQALVSRGVKVVCLDVAVEAGQKEAATLNSEHGPDTVTFLRCDVTNLDQLRECFQQAVTVLGHIDIVFNNAGLVMENRWQYMVDVNIKGVVEGTNLAVEHMRKDKGGKGGVIINTASYAGLVPRFFFPVYAATKFAVTGFTASWASNPYLKDMGLRFGSLCPTSVDTAFQRFKDEQLLYPEEFKEMNKVNGMLPVGKAVEGFLQLVEDDDSNGSNMTVTKHGVLFRRLVVEDGKGLAGQ